LVSKQDFNSVARLGTDDKPELGGKFAVRFGVKYLYKYKKKKKNLG